MMATTRDISGNIIKQTVKSALEEVLKEKGETTNESQAIAIKIIIASI